MSRAIDADALKEQIESHVVSMSVCLSVDEHYGKVTMREECLQDIADAPTIEAIPVEWIKALTNHSDMFTRGAAKWVLGCWKREQGAQDDKV